MAGFSKAIAPLEAVRDLIEIQFLAGHADRRDEHQRGHPIVLRRGEHPH